MLMRNRRSVLLAATGMLAAPAIARAQLAQSPPGVRLTLAKAIASDDRLTRFAMLIARTGVDRRLDEAGQFTVFAPTDSAFGWLPAPVVESLLGRRGGAGETVVDSSRSNSVALQHVVAYSYPLARLNGTTEDLEALNGGKLHIEGAKNPIELRAVNTPGVLSAPGLSFPGTAKIVAADNFASNGVVHVIDTLLLP
jgi:uncharacterized surface protein with fasciclin (FAS1) repeats